MVVVQGDAAEAAEGQCGVAQLAVVRGVEQAAQQLQLVAPTVLPRPPRADVERSTAASPPPLSRPCPFTCSNVKRAAMHVMHTCLPLLCSLSCSSPLLLPFHSAPLSFSFASSFKRRRQSQAGQRVAGGAGH